MKRGSYFINTARGPMVDYQALHDALASGHLRGAMLETFWQEPPPPDAPLLRLENVTLTPHIAGASLKTVKIAARMVADESAATCAASPSPIPAEEARAHGPEGAGVPPRDRGGGTPMNASGLNQGTSGNISARYGDRMLITPSAIPYETRPRSLASLPLEGEYGSWDGPLRPSTEWRFHLDITRAGGPRWGRSSTPTPPTARRWRSAARRSRPATT